MKDLEKFLKVLADKNRLRIIMLLERKKMCVCEVASILQVTQPAVSRHLRKMKSAGIIGGEKDGLWTNYYLKKSNTNAEKILNQIKLNLNEDSLIKEDLKRMKKVDRTKVCCS